MTVQRVFLFLTSFVAGYLILSVAHSYSKSTLAIQPTTIGATYTATLTSQNAGTNIKLMSNCWLLIASTNYPQYIKSLREIGCPELTIAAIIRSEFKAKYQQQAGGRISTLDAVSEQRERNLESNKILTDFDLPLDPWYGFTFEQAKRMQEAKKRVFEKNLVLSQTNIGNRLGYIGLKDPKETAYFKAEILRFGSRIADVLTTFRPTENEFYAILNAMEDGSSEELKKKLPDILTTDRYALFLSSQNPVHQELFTLCTWNGLPNSIMPKLEKILQEQDDLTPQEYRRKLQALLDPFVFLEFQHRFPNVENPGMLKNLLK